MLATLMRHWPSTRGRFNKIHRENAQGTGLLKMTTPQILPLRRCRGCLRSQPTRTSQRGKSEWRSRFQARMVGGFQTSTPNITS